jgi:hypothetical protein
MNAWKTTAVVAVAGLVASLGTQIASAAGDRHPNLTHASEHLGAAANDVSAAQVANEYDMQGHAANAKKLIAQAQSELAAARQAASGR